MTITKTKMIKMLKDHVAKGNLCQEGVNDAIKFFNGKRLTKKNLVELRKADPELFSYMNSQSKGDLWGGGLLARTRLGRAWRSLTKDL